MEIINIIAIALSPVIAVLITIFLTNRIEKKRAKMEIFKTLMSTRYIANTTHEKVRALNSIDVIFADSQKVRDAWKSLYDIYMQATPAVDKQTDGMLLLLEAMAGELGYKEKIKWDNIKNSYLPNGLAQDMRDEATYKQLQLNAIKSVSMMGQAQVPVHWQIPPNDENSFDASRYPKI